MSRPGTPSAKTAGSRSHKEDVLQFLDNLDSFEGSGSPSKDAAASTSKAGTLSSRSVAPSAATTATPGDNADDPQAVLDFLDEIVANRDRRSATPSNNTSSSATTGGKKAATSGSTAGASSVSRSTSRTTLRDGETSAAGTARSARDKDAAVPSRKSGESARSLNMTAASSSSAAGQAATKLQEAPLPEESSPAAEAPKAGGWGWGSVWSQASNVLQQAKTVAEEQAKHLPKNLPASLANLQNQLPVSTSDASSQAQAGVTAATAQAQKWRSGMMNMLSNQLDIEKLRKEITETGMKAMQDIMNAVAPPIAEHEVIQVNLSHDMLGYEGVETLVYRALAKVMEQVEGGDLVVNKGNVEDSPSGVPRSTTKLDTNAETEDDDERNLNTVEGFVEAYKLAEANLDALIKKHYTGSQADSQASSDKAPHHGRKESGLSIPVTICPVYMRIQPVLAFMPFATGPSTSSGAVAAPAQLKTSDDLHLFFIMILRDPTNELVHKTLTQSMPSKWLDIPFEENEWVEDIMVDIIRRGVEIIGEEYIKGRMHGRLLKNAKTETLFEEAEETEEQKEERGEKMSEAQAGVSA